jgi:hypothetical protein
VAGAWPRPRLETKPVAAAEAMKVRRFSIEFPAVSTSQTKAAAGRRKCRQ